MPTAATYLHELCDALEGALRGTTRREVIDAVCAPGGGGEALHRLRSMMGTHRFRRARGSVTLDRLVERLDHRTREDGFRILHNWDHTSHRFTEDIVPVLLLDYYIGASGEGASRVALEILLDAYFFHLLTLCAMRAWDDDDPDASLGRVAALLDELQGPDGSGHRFVQDAETLIIYGLSQFHPDEHAYDRLIEKVKTLSDARQTAFAQPSASVLSCHLRWGFWLMYERDVLRMRDDNVGDYPWLLNSVTTLAREYARLHDAEEHGRHRSNVVDSLLQGLAADPWAFTGKAPPALSDYEAQYSEVRALLTRYGSDLLEEMATHRPSRELYSPLALHFNFPHNALVAILMTALLAGEPQPLPLNALFMPDHGPHAEEGESASPPERLARELMAYSGASRDRLGAHGALLVAYDPYSGARSFSMTLDAIRKGLPST
jgi:hypothetical protein